MKAERLISTDNANNLTANLATYHIKPLMLWHCVLIRRNCWTDDLDLVKICVQLLHKLAEWLTDTWCPHYFISKCNLIDSSFSVTNTVG